MGEKEVTQKRNDFGAKGWILILYLAIGFFLITGVTADLLNTTIPAWAELKGWSISRLYAYGQVAGIAQIIGIIVFSRVIKKTGARKLGIILVIISIVCFLCWRFVDAIPLYIFMYCVMMVSISGSTYVVNSAIIANWFPTRKGMVLGWATMGAQMSGVAGVALFSNILNNFGLGNAFAFWAIFPFAMLLFLIFFVRNNPEERGFNPDNDKNMTPEMAQKLLEEGREYERTSQWTVKKLLTTRYMWLTAVAAGPPLMFCIGVMSSFISRAGDMGIAPEKAIGLMALVTALGIPGSYLIGWFDQKLGTPNALKILYVMSGVALLLNLAGSVNVVFYYIGIILFAATLGGGNNMPTSLIAHVFGRYDFANGYSTTYPVINVIMTFGFTLVGALATSAGGSYKMSYLILIAIAVVGFIVTCFVPKTCIGRN